MLEALDKGRGPVATVLVQKGALESGTPSSRARTWFARWSTRTDRRSASPAQRPAQVLGWNGVPNVGDEFREVDDEREARHVAAERGARSLGRRRASGRPRSRSCRRQERQDIPELNLVVKADVQGRSAR